jgi:hypothetical protein
VMLIQDTDFVAAVHFLEAHLPSVTSNR